MLSTLLDKLWFQFCSNHPEVANCQANQSVMNEFAERSGLLLEGFDAATYDYILAQIPDRLAFVPQAVPKMVQPTADELRQAENARLRGMTTDQLHREIRAKQAHVAPIINLPYTALQIKQMPVRALRDLISYSNGQERPGYRKAVNKILRGE